MRAKFLAALLLLATGITNGQDSGDYARMSRAAWAAFQCAAFASVMGNPTEQERLFQFGYDQGKAFVLAAQSGKVEAKDIDSISPTGFLFRAQGPTPDFIIGRVFESSQENALKDVLTTETILEKELQKSIASRKYMEGNCEVLGRER